jgi:hypothetical protein
MVHAMCPWAAVTADMAASVHGSSFHVIVPHRVGAGLVRLAGGYTIIVGRHDWLGKVRQWLPL